MSALPCFIVRCEVSCAIKRPPTLELVGAAYLGVLAVRTLMSARRVHPEMQAPAREAAVSVLRRSTLTALLTRKG